ncbi:MAG TPA: hypothetical protein VNO26_13880 [Candidatus Limnocylindria bacterium]|nr:hypothetical protein [Candidatus Limnocylindria bacterium]
METLHVVLPSQVLSVRGRSRAEPQRRLMLAVLQAVVDDVVAGAAGRRAVLGDARAYEQALAYVESRDRSWPFSFENICETMGLDAEGIRRTLSRYGHEPEQRSA